MVPAREAARKIVPTNKRRRSCDLCEAPAMMLVVCGIDEGSDGEIKALTVRSFDQER